jgi:hypothetical protein
MPKTHVHTRVVFNRIPELMLHVKIGTKEVLEHTAEAMAEDAKSRLIPGQFGYDTGAARDSIEGVVTSQRTAELRGGGDKAPHFAYNEFGTRFRAAAPALVPAFEAHKDDFGVNMAKLITAFH